MNTKIQRAVLSALIRIWLPIAVASVLLCGLVEITVQQNYRQSANDPQIQMAEDFATSLDSSPLSSIRLPSGKIPLEASMATFVVFYDADGVPAASTGTLHGALPTIPRGVLETAKIAGQNRVTWQPESSLRFATVTLPLKAGQGYVMVGRSLYEVEKREADLTKHVAMALACILIATLLTVVAVAWLDKKYEHRMA